MEFGIEIIYSNTRHVLLLSCTNLCCTSLQSCGKRLASGPEIKINPSVSPARPCCQREREEKTKTIIMKYCQESGGYTCRNMLYFCYEGREHRSMNVGQYTLGMFGKYSFGYLRRRMQCPYAVTAKDRSLEYSS